MYELLRNYDRPEMSYDECAVYVMFMLSDVIAERSAS